ncbi:MAG: type II toxin-antitoxin system VapC family toxin [Clostridia bacterium]|nr:type II toxin-antitoxin system VapC family toxin [Clostridia bacterium]MCL6647145.1 type II toxin-antitoxin system VapC family toxin [Chloroflexota bacterium]
MTRWVVDASVVVPWAVPEPGSEPALRIRDAFARGRLELLAPGLLVAEAANAIWKKGRLRGELTDQEARQALALLLAALPELVPDAPLATQALDLALTYRHPVYDCLYVALALRERCPLVTADAALRAAFAPTLGRLVLSPEEAASELR